MRRRAPRQRLRPPARDPPRRDGECGAAARLGAGPARGSLRGGPGAARNSGARIAQTPPRRGAHPTSTRARRLRTAPNGLLPVAAGGMTDAASGSDSESASEPVGRPSRTRKRR